MWLAKGSGKLLTVIALGALAGCIPWGLARRVSAPGLGIYGSNGERIYYTGTSERGGAIRYAGGPAIGGMMSGRLSCASCHGEDGRGGEHWMHMERMDAPDIRWETLAGGQHGDHGGEGGEAGEEAEAYDEASFKLAVTQGIEPGGGELSREMPRWRMSDEDLDDLILFLQSLQ